MKRILLIFLTIFVPSAVCSMTMDEALRYGLVQNPELRALRLEEGVAKAQLQKAKLPLISNPTMEGNILEKGKGGGIERTFTDYGISISQEFEIAGQSLAAHPK